MSNRAVEHNVAAFSELYAVIRWQERLNNASTMSNSINLINVKLLTTATMVGNLAEKVDECLLNCGH